MVSFKNRVLKFGSMIKRGFKYISTNPKKTDNGVIEFWDLSKRGFPGRGGGGSICSDPDITGICNE